MSSIPLKWRLISVADVILQRVLRFLPCTSRSEYIALWWGYRARAAKKVVPLRCGARIQVEPFDHLQILIYYCGVFEPHCERIIKDLLKPGEVFVDIGANIGCHTLQAAMIVGGNGRVIAIEPHPINAQELLANLKLNDLQNVTVCETAVGMCSGRVLLQLPPGGNRGCFTVADVGGCGTEVGVETLDKILSDCKLSRVDVLKLDVEGAEFGVLQGGNLLLSTDYPAVLIEINGPALERCGTSSKLLIQLLAGYRYRGWIVTDNGFEELQDDAPSDSCVECIFVHESRDDQLERLGLS